MSHASNTPRAVIGYALCGSFCTFEKSLEQLAVLLAQGYDVYPIMSDMAYSTDTRFGEAKVFRERIEAMCGRPILHTIPETEPLGPSVPMDALVICPCTGNTLSKLACGMTDTPVCMAAKAHLRCDRPLLIALASNDAMSANLGNIATLMKRKQVFFTPMFQDDPIKKPHSLVADFSQLPLALTAALNGKQLRKVFL